MSREIARRLSALESARSEKGIRYTVSDRPLTDEVGEASLVGDLVEHPEGLSPIMAVEEWQWEYGRSL
jgi:hypothetical protein